MKKEKTTSADEYICEDCGTTTPVVNDSCASCGGRLLPVDEMREPTEDELTTEKDDQIASAGEDESESLESLAEKELSDDQRSYNEDSYGDE